MVARPAAVGEERGNAAVEFTGVVAILLVPLLYLVLALSATQGATLAAAAAAREAGRAMVTAHPDPRTGMGGDGETAARQRAAVAARLAFEDQGKGSLRREVTITCPPAGCFEPGAAIRVSVKAHVPLPGLGGLGGLGTIGVEASHVAITDRFKARRNR